jgi:hypothetical protein
MCSQTDSDFRLIVICNVRPQLEYDDPRVIYHIVNFAAPSRERRPVGSDPLSSHPARTDKGTKLLTGMLLARRFNPTHFAFVDADDLVSNRVAAFANAQPSHPGWYVDAGYVANYETMRIQRRHSLVRYCGSTLIPNASALYELSNAARSLDETSEQGKLLAGVSRSFFKHVLSDHTYTVQYLANHGLVMRPIPFRAVAWVQQNGENYSGVRGTISGIPATPSFCQEFGLAALPANGRSAKVSDHLREMLISTGSRLGSLRSRLGGFPSVPRTTLSNR